ncbi:MAG: hypothetical protein ACI85K_000447, partial [Hyphomicrobiaceae bacterium]
TGGDVLPARPVAELNEHSLLTQMTVARLAEGVA